MINENMKKVLVALRSGEYKQVHGTIQNHCGYCVLGVMCDVYERETGHTLRRRAVDDEDDITDNLLIGSDLDDHLGVRKWVGLLDGEGVHDSGPSLMIINDIEKKTFLEIADYIESNPKGLLEC
jgi:hypothetical protein